MTVFFSFDLRLKFLRCVKISWTQDFWSAFIEEIKMLLRVIIFSVILNKKYLRNVPVSSSCVQDCALAEKPFGCHIKQYLLMQKQLLQLIKLPKRREKKLKGCWTKTALRISKIIGKYLKVIPIKKKPYLGVPKQSYSAYWWLMQQAPTMYFTTKVN